MLGNTTSAPSKNWHISTGFGAHGVCGVVVYYEDDSMFSVIKPRSAICNESEDETTDYMFETRFFVLLTQWIGLAIFALAAWRARDRSRVDWWRLISLYAVGTLAYVVSIYIGPGTGFNRVEAIGAIIHNVCELIILFSMWFGTDKLDRREDSFKKSKWSRSIQIRVVTIYLWIMLISIAMMPLPPLFFIAMFQGSFCDYMLFLTFVYCGEEMQRYDINDKNGKYYRGAATHLVAVQPLFFAISTGHGSLGVGGVFLLFPTIALYIWFASADTPTLVALITPHTQPKTVKMRTNDMQTLIDSIGSIPIKETSIPSINTSTTINTTVTNDNAPYLRPPSKAPGNVSIELAYSADEENINSVTGNGLIGDSENGNSGNGKVLGTVLEHGLCFKSDTKKSKGYFYKIFILSFVFSFTNSMIVFFAPCYLTSFVKSICD